MLKKWISCDGHQVHAVIDTASVATIISPSYCNLIKKKIHPWNGSSVVLANRERMKPIGAVDIELEINNQKVRVTALVITIHDFKLLVGTNVLKKIRDFRIEFERETSSQASTEIQNEDSNELVTYKVISNESKSIPPLSMVPVRVQTSGSLAPEVEGVIEPSKKVMKDKQLNIGRTYVPASVKVETLLVTNFSKVPQWINSGMTLGVLQPAELIQVNPIQESQEKLKVPIDESLFRAQISKELGAEDTNKVLALLMKYGECFAVDNSELGRCNLAQHSIDTGPVKPVRQLPYSNAWKQREIIQKEVSEMLEDGVISPSISPWASPVVLVIKPDKTWRFCVDYRRLNALTQVPVYPLPRIEDSLSRLEGSCIFSNLDLQCGFWQIPLNPNDIKKTAFVTADGHYEFNFMPYGLAGAPASFQAMMDVLLAGLKWNTCLIYLDDVVLFSSTIDQHLMRLEAVLIRIMEANLRIKLKKCHFFESILKILGFVVDKNGILPDPAKLRAVRDYPQPKSIKETQSFIGLCSFYRKFLKGFSIIARPLTQLTRKNHPFVWDIDQQVSFQALKDQLTSPPLLCHPDYNLPFEIHPDGSGFGIGAVILQWRDGNCRIIAYASRLLNKHERNYSVTEIECLALIWAVKKFRLYIWGQKVKIVTDHHALCYLMTKRDLSGRLARWSLTLQEFDIQIVHRSGRLHTDADALSRFPVDGPESEEDDLPMYNLNLEDEPPDVKDKQRKCDRLNKIIIGLQNEDQKVRERFRKFVLVDHLLYRRSIKHGQERLRLCVPPSLCDRVMKSCHDQPSSGRLGFHRTIVKIRNRHDWPGMDGSLRDYIRTCIKCQTRKEPRYKPAGYLQSIITEKPFQNIGIDVLGPFPISRRKNRFIIVVVDYLTKWAITIALPDSKTQQIVDFIVENIVLQHGAPTTLISDGGKNLTSRMMEEVLSALKIDHRVATGYHPQSLGQVERLNHTLAVLLSMYVNEQHDNWDEMLSAITFAYNTSRQETTGYTPFFLLFGREPRLPIDVVFGSSPVGDVIISSSDYANDLISRLSNARSLLKVRMGIMQSKQAHYYNNRRRESEFKEGDIVLVYKPIRKVGRADKLIHHFVGPYKVIRKITPLNYEIQLLSRRKKSEIVHVCRMKLFHFRESQLRKEPVERTASMDVNVDDEEERPSSPLMDNVSSDAIQGDPGMSKEIPRLTAAGQKRKRKQTDSDTRRVISRYCLRSSGEVPSFPSSPNSLI